ncbi:MAG: 3-hydroxyacyl-CoA dehydrogenase PaaC [Neisseriaceae bacterium]|nr:3-hydroxyacyl-CoA dehydrogenase PaaC [Neisseriaceae bacterium]MBP6861162.1 3-hydroxyacyl-CoA dehydrogenase PaaC [Neisseriaceae bacterium]
MGAMKQDQVIAVVGTGAMGAGIAQVAAVAGHPVKLLDVRPGAAAAAVSSIQGRIERLLEKGRISAEVAAKAKAQLQPVSTLEDLADASLVIEAINEDLASKQKLYADLENIVSADCVFGSNTSSISITAIGSALQQPERLAGLHFFNPAPLMALVEVVAGLATSSSVLETLYATAEAWGKAPVYTKSTPGFIVNRVARPYYAEALRVYQEQGADAATIDACCREAGGFRMGPFELMDLIGHDVNFAVTQSVWQAFYYDQRFLPSLVQQDLVYAGFLGKKSGRGFYDYREGAVTPQPQTAAAAAYPAGVRIHGESLAAQALASRLQANGLAFETAPAVNGRLATIGDAVLCVTDGRSASQRAFDNQQPNTVLMDLALDYATATRLAISAGAACAPEALQAMIGLLQGGGLAVSVLADVPGLVVMRTVAMLANEAADAVNQGVGSVDGIDKAMRLGVNYPQGPLAWGQSIGFDKLQTVLRHLGQTYGEDRYRVSPWLQQRVLGAPAHA